LFDWFRTQSNFFRDIFFCHGAACTTSQSIILVISIEATVKIFKFPLVQRNKRLAEDVATSGALRKIAIEVLTCMTHNVTYISLRIFTDTLFVSSNISCATAETT
jgi:hypothetical protein